MDSEQSRPGWDEYFMEITRVVASRSTCLRRKVGAILVLEKRILATGYNGPPAGLPHCGEVGCIRDKKGIPSGENLHLCRGTHAEANLITQCAKFGIRAEGSTLYINTSPCNQCMKLLININIEKIVYMEKYSDPLSWELAEQAGIRMQQFKWWKYRE